MKIINFGSLNIDHVYQVPHFVQPGETLPCRGYQRHAGGKGLNQSIALARAGVEVWHAGCVGTDGRWLVEYLERCGVDTHLVEISPSAATGHAVIQVTPSGENAIVLHGGANREFGSEYIAQVLTFAQPGDWVLLQNETSGTREIIAGAVAAGCRVIFNPAPMSADVKALPLSEIACLIVNEIEGAELAQRTAPHEMLSQLADLFPHAVLVVTLGSSGVMAQCGQERISLPAEKVQAIDTTAAGDTFVGYFSAGLLQGAPFKECLEIANCAAALCVTRPGAADSIPQRAAVEAKIGDGPCCSATLP